MKCTLCGKDHPSIWYNYDKYKWCTKWTQIDRSDEILKKHIPGKFCKKHDARHCSACTKGKFLLRLLKHLNKKLLLTETKLHQKR